MDNLITLPVTWHSSVYAEEEAAAAEAAARERQAMQDLMDHPKWRFVAQCFETTVGYPLKPWQLLELVSNNQDEQLIFAALQDTRKAPRPSYYYLRAILERCQASGISTLSDYIQDQAQHRALLNARWRRAT